MDDLPSLTNEPRLVHDLRYDNYSQFHSASIEHQLRTLDNGRWEDS